MKIILFIQVRRKIRIRIKLSFIIKKKRILLNINHMMVIKRINMKKKSIQMKMDLKKFTLLSLERIIIITIIIKKENIKKKRNMIIIKIIIKLKIQKSIMKTMLRIILKLLTLQFQRANQCLLPLKPLLLMFPIRKN